MKKIVFSWMSLLVSVPVFFSCTEKELETAPAAETVYTYHFEIAEDDTRATLNDRGVSWQADDQVGVFFGNSNSVAADVNLTTTPKTIDLSTESPLSPGTVLHAYYPYLNGNSSASGARIVFPQNQEGGSVSAMPLAGVPFEVRDGTVTNGSIFFLNLGSIIDFHVYAGQRAGEQIRSITFSVDAGSVAGEAMLDLTRISRTEGDYQIPDLAWTDGKSSVTVTQNDHVALTKPAAAENHLYMVIAPGTYSGTISVVTNAATYAFPFTNLAFERNGLRGVNLNLDSRNAVRTTTYTKISSSSQMVDKESYLIVYDGVSPARVFHPKLNSDGSTYQTTDNVETVTIESNQIMVVAGSAIDASRVVLEKVSGSNSDYYIKVPNAGNQYLYLSNGSLKVGQNASTFTFNSNGSITIKRSSNRYYLKYTTNNPAFSSVSANSSPSSFALFKQDDGGLTVQSLEFSSASFSYNISGQQLPLFNVDGVPTLTGAHTNVTYYSSDPSVASVSSDGSITVYKDGTTVITAVAMADDHYQQGMASYFIRIEDGFSIENDKLATYLNLVEANPYNPPDYSTTHMTAELQSGNTDQVNRTDWPKPVPVSWTNPTTGNADKVVYVYNDEAMQNLELSVSVTSTFATSADVYNLIPNRVYYYKVMNGNDAVPIADGSFKTTGRRRMIKVADSPYGRAYANNCRDFGGQITSDGRRIKYGKLFRGSNMDKVTNAQYTYLRQFLNIGLDVDLRANTSGSVGSGDEMLNDPLGLNEGHTSETFGSWSDFANPKSNGTYKMTTILTKIFATIDAGKGVYIHCKVGADRTGYVCMLLEAILGVEQGWCDVDYELTSFSGAVDSGKGRWRVGTVSGLSNNYYYRTSGNTVQGVDYIYNLSVGDYGTVYPNNSFQAKAVNYVVGTLGIPFETVQTFQDNMLEN